jgi:hypothetical protein
VLPMLAKKTSPHTVTGSRKCASASGSAFRRRSFAPVEEPLMIPILCDCVRQRLIPVKKPRHWAFHPVVGDESTVSGDE